MSFQILRVIIVNMKSAIKASIYFRFSYILPATLYKGDNHSAEIPKFKNSLGTISLIQNDVTIFLMIFWEIKVYLFLTYGNSCNTEQMKDILGSLLK